MKQVLATMIAAVVLSFGSPGARADEPGWWKPGVEQRIALHWMLAAPLNVTDPAQMGLRDPNGNVLPEPDVYDIDGAMNTAATVAYLHGRGKRVICYIDAGVYESYRKDATKFQAITPQIWGNADVEWDDSYWLDVRRIADLEPIMKARMQDCKNKGFDAVEPDEIDGWENDTGFPITYQDQLNYNRALAQWAHELGLSIGQKGDIIQTRDLVDSFDWTLNEECFEYEECTGPYDPILDTEVPGLQLYVQRNKAVFIAEYDDSEDWNSVCAASTASRFNTSRFKLGLPRRGGRTPCSTSIGW